MYSFVYNATFCLNDIYSKEILNINVLGYELIVHSLENRNNRHFIVYIEDVYLQFIQIIIRTNMIVKF